MGKTMKRNLIIDLLLGCALLWSNNLSADNCPSYDTAISSFPYIANKSSSCLDIAQFPLSSCLSDTTYHSSSSLASDPVGGRIYQAMFNATDWTGQLLAYQTDQTTGAPAQTSLWDAGNVLTTLTKQMSNNNGFTLTPYSFNHPSTASFGSYNSTTQYPSSKLAGIALTLPNLSDTQNNKLDTKTVNAADNAFTYNITDYFTGYTTCERPNTCYYLASKLNSNSSSATFSFRQRPVLLGDLVNSDPLFVGSEDFNYDNLSESTTSSYRTFVNNKRQPDTSGNPPRPRMVYVGGNDGRLHGFEAGTWNRDIANAFDSGRGTEFFSFFPGSVIGYDLFLRAFDSSSYATPFTDKNPRWHRYLVDGSPKMGDAYLNGAWHTVLLGTTAGAASTFNGQVDHGGSIFALDVTRPECFYPTSAAKDPTGCNPFTTSTVSNKTTPNVITTTSTGISNILWEFTNNQDLIDLGQYRSFPLSSNWADADLGVTLSQPSLVRMQNGKWAVIVGNGYNSANQKPVLYILDFSLKPSDAKFIIAKLTPCTANSSACPNSLNGLSTPIAVDVDGDRKADYIYAGDLQGNLWKFDVNCTGVLTNGDYLGCQSSKSSTDWGVANGGKPLFVACTTDPCSNTNRQPITGKPQVGSVSAAQANSLYSYKTQTKASVMVYFGTGSYLGLCDIETAPSGTTCSQQQQNSSQQQTFYALWDKNTGDAKTDNSIAGRNSLYQQTILTPSTITQSDGKTAVTNVRVTSVAPTNLPCYQANPNSQCTLTDSSKVNSQSGWYLNLSMPSSGPSERSVYFPLLLNGNVVFTPLIPSADPCTTQPSSMVMELDAITGNRPTNPAFLNLFNTNSSGNSPTNDFVTATIAGATTTMAPSGVQSTVGILKTPALVYTPNALVKTFSGSTGGIQQVKDPVDTLGRVSWRQLR